MNNDRSRQHSGAQVICAAIAAMIIIMTQGCADHSSWQRTSGMIWHTSWHATYEGSPDLMTAAIDSLKSVEHSISVFDSTSLISAVNASRSGLTDKHLRNVYYMSRKINQLSGGMFDPTMSRLIDAWGFGKNHTVSADTANINELLKNTGITKTRIQNGILYKDSPDISFNFSAIAKGYGVDMAAKALSQQGCHNLMLEIGGEIVCRGVNPEGKKWRIKIDTPDEEYLRETFDRNHQPNFGKDLIIELDNEALATSGNYRNFRKGKGQTFGHTISPKTGRPVLTDILSASVIAPSCIEADALATACMAMGSVDAMKMLTKEKMAGAFILNTGEIIMNDKMKKHICKQQ